MTPISKAGNSGSAYSLMSWDEFQITDAQISQFKKYNVMTDVVLNHLSSDSEVLVKVPNSYNNYNRFDLKPAILLDFHL